MPTARTMFNDCRDLANRCRRIASRAASRGHRMWAINLVTKAQRYDAAAEDWRATVPQWQWDAY